MIKIEFGIIDDFKPDKVYKDYEPQRYNCVSIDDDIYINDWWSRLIKLQTYNMSINKPQTALTRWGVTIIPPSSLTKLLEIVISDKRINKDENLVHLADKIREAIEMNKFMIHFGV